MSELASLSEEGMHTERSSGQAESLAEDKEVQVKNLELMHTEMQRLLQGESRGGNAGAIEVNGKEYVCTAANGFVNPETGEILIFGNIQFVDKDIQEKGSAFTFRVAQGNLSFGLGGMTIESPWDRPDQIIEVVVDEQKVGSRARENLQDAIAVYNSEPGQKEFKTELAA